MLSSSLLFQAAITKQCRLGSLNNMILEARSQIKMLAGFFFLIPLFVKEIAVFLCPYMIFPLYVSVS